ncbi:YihY family inner membrane protein [Rubrobacter marinus]|uniref:YihY family inner membrane protein n=1 Tax=Rubrobacter marinus TaxID=2653852 RepID=A0A6G8PZV1_9ACTN|nr:YihY/virulence factor BrkB family protein [Rubrobacter marinus]QIN79732.1 YihY family inner membrane protein [Rubrobacter marinus]
MQSSDDNRSLDPVEDLGLSEAEVRGVAKRPVRGSLTSFLRDMKTLLSFAALKRAAREFQSDDALGLAAQLAYYLVLALFPFILFLVAVLDTFSNPEFARSVLVYLQQVLPGEVYGIIEGYIEQFLGNDNSAPGLLSLGILGTIWAASGAFSAIINALNKAYDVEETRPYWKVKGIAILLTIGLSGLILTGVLLLVAGPPIGEAVAGYFGLGEEFEIAWNIARWPAALLFLVLTVALIYYFAPDAEQPFRWITPGGFVGVLLWILASLAFRFYIANFGGNSYSATYGSIGAVIILLLYLYISSLAILFGAELNATLVRMKQELSGKEVLDAEPANEKPDILEGEGTGKET